MLTILTKDFLNRIVPSSVEVYVEIPARLKLMNEIHYDWNLFYLWLLLQTRIV